MSRVSRDFERAQRQYHDEHRRDLRRILDGEVYLRVTDTATEYMTKAEYMHATTPETLSKKRPRKISEADWRMALRRKLNGDTR